MLARTRAFSPRAARPPWHSRRRRSFRARIRPAARVECGHRCACRLQDDAGPVPEIQPQCHLMAAAGGIPGQVEPACGMKGEAVDGPRLVDPDALRAGERKRRHNTAGRTCNRARRAEQRSNRHRIPFMYAKAARLITREEVDDRDWRNGRPTHPRRKNNRCRRRRASGRVIRAIGSLNGCQARRR